MEVSPGGGGLRQGDQVGQAWGEGRGRVLGIVALELGAEGRWRVRFLGGSRRPWWGGVVLYPAGGETKCPRQGGASRPGRLRHPSLPVLNRLQVGKRGQLTLPKPSSAPAL